MEQWPNCLDAALVAAFVPDRRDNIQLAANMIRDLRRQLAGVNVRIGLAELTRDALQSSVAAAQQSAADWQAKAVAWEAKAKASEVALEQAWVDTMAHAGSCWDTLDDLEDAIASITGETDKQVNQRLYAKNKRFIKAQAGKEDTRWNDKDELARLRSENEKHVAAMKVVEERLGQLNALAVSTHNSIGLLRVDRDRLAKIVDKMWVDNPLATSRVVHQIETDAAALAAKECRDAK
jgi:hypothetical protein